MPQVGPLGMARSPYPDRIDPRVDLSEADRKALEKRTLTNLYNQRARPGWRRRRTAKRTRPSLRLTR